MIGQMAFPGSQGWINEKNISCKNPNFLSFCVNISKYNELKSGVENITVGNLGVYLIFILKPFQLFKF